MGYQLNKQVYEEFDCQAAIIAYLELLKNQTKRLTYVSMPNEFVDFKRMGKAKKGGMRPGWPDITIMLEGRRTFYIELKLTDGDLMDHQRQIHNELRKLGFMVYVVRADTPYEAQNKVSEILRNDFKFFDGDKDVL